MFCFFLLFKHFIFAVHYFLQQWLHWHHAAPVLLVGTKEGQIWMWKVPSGDCKTFAGYGPSAVCGKILPDGKRNVLC